MPRNRKLNLKREALSELSAGELVGVVGGPLTDACIEYTKVCVTVGVCVTDNCTYTCFYTFQCTT